MENDQDETEKPKGSGGPGLGIDWRDRTAAALLPRTAVSRLWCAIRRAFRFPMKVVS
jgi:hypothetical protein